METNLLKCRTLVVKVASRCNLNCTYCYMYNMGDETYKSQPKTMSREVVDHILYRAVEHCEKLNLTDFTFVLHGGEPLLAEMDFFRYFTQKARREIPDTVKYRFIVQTNALLLTKEWCRLFGELNIGLGISLDGLKTDNDQFRIDHAGRGSYDRIINGLRIAQQSPDMKSKPGLLSVININADPVESYRHFKTLKVTGVDWLLPEATYDNPPFLPESDKSWAGETPYGDWLIAIFDQWFEDTDERFDIRQFYYIVHAVLGGEFNADNLGQLNNEVLVIETDGGIEAVDGLKSCGNGFTKAGANVRSHSFDEAMQTPLARLYHLSHHLLPQKCLACPVKEVCGGGTIAHRYHTKNGFNNPSVYCSDLLKLITHVQNKVVASLPSELINDSGISALTYADALKIINENLPLTAEPDYVKALLFNAE
jgi:uncharacterized protein